MFVEVVSDTCDEGSFRARYEKVEVVIFGMLDQGGEVGVLYVGDVLAFWDAVQHVSSVGMTVSCGVHKKKSKVPQGIVKYLPSSATITWDDMYAFYLVALCQLPGECVFAAAVAYQQYP